MLAKVESRAIYGICAYRVDVEVDVGGGMPGFYIVGLPDRACNEASKRVITALRNSGYVLPSRRIVINLAPAYIKKEGPVYDLAIAVGVLVAIGQLDKQVLDDKVLCGELSLDGALRSIKGVISIADNVNEVKTKRLLLPYANLREAATVMEGNAIGAQTLNEVLAYLVEGTLPAQGAQPQAIPERQEISDIDYSDIKGNAHAKRAMEVAVAGGHNILLIGPPGVGKTMLARRLPTIMGEISRQEAIETTKIYSIAGMLDNKGGLIRKPPFRILHHSISNAGMVGGGINKRPGEISLAHNGVLFIDELAEFRKDVLELIRQPLEEGMIRISRANMSVAYPSRFMLVAAMNPCPCGFLTHPDRACNCTSAQVQRYLSKISGPLLDRIDMHIEVQPVKYEQIRQQTKAEGSQQIKERIQKARKVQQNRYEQTGCFLNAQMAPKVVNQVCSLTDEASRLLQQAMSEFFFSARAHDKILKVAQTISDLDDRPIIGVEEIAEAIGYRGLDNKLWLS